MSIFIPVGNKDGYSSTNWLFKQQCGLTSNGAGIGYSNPFMCGDGYGYSIAFCQRISGFRTTYGLYESRSVESMAWGTVELRGRRGPKRPL